MKPSVHSDKTHKWDDLDDFRHAQFVLVGQPNCGKSTIFNEVAGYRSITGNFPGATVEYTRGHVNVLNNTYDVVDLPGTYSLSTTDQAERVSQRYLLTQRVDVIINVVDASILSRSLELTLQLMELEIPMILCLNMMDEAERKGIHINTVQLSELLGIPVIETIASKGRGIKQLFVEALKTARNRQKPKHIQGNRDVERVIAGLIRVLKKEIKPSAYSVHLLATKLLEKDPFFVGFIKSAYPGLAGKILEFRKKLSRSHGRSSDEVISFERHALSMSIFEKVATVSKPRISWQDRMDRVLMHNIWGYVCLVLVLLVFFNLVFGVGRFLELPLIGLFDRLSGLAENLLGADTLPGVIVTGSIEGIGGGIAIVLPYLLPFLLGLSFLEDIGYLPRIAFLMDSFMHKIGLHGTAVIPAVLGYGCNVPAVMATRILDSPRDRFIAALISTMVPCSARMTIIFGLAGYYLGGMVAFGLYMFNLVVIAFSGWIFSRILKEATPGMMMEIPAYHLPRIQSVLKKTWFRTKDFIVIAWPLLIAGSAVLALTEYFHLTGHINQALQPLTAMLGLPTEVGTTLIFGVLRKELSMLMLFQALGTTDMSTVMSNAQMLVFTVFVVFYIPCVATIGVLFKQVKLKGVILITFYTFLIATVLALIIRIFAEYVL